MPETLCERFAAALCGPSFDALPEEVLHAGKRSLLDALGSALAGCDTTEVTALAEATRAWGGAGPVSVWGGDLKFSAPHAALINGTAVHAREVDDFGGCGHSGAVVVPAALGAAQLHDVSGAQLLKAICAGYEAAGRVTNLAGGYAEHNAAGWHGTGTCGVFGAAAAAGRVLGLDAGRMSHALALAGTYTGGIWSFIADGAMSKRLHAGKAAEGGVVAALLAQRQITGPSHLFENEWGSFTSMYAAGKADHAALMRDVGEDFMIFRSGFKPYACCRGCHSSLDALLQLRARDEIGADQVDHITIHASEHMARQLGKQDIDNVLDAQMSLPYSMALGLRFGRADLEHYDAPYLADASLRALARKITVVGEPARATGSEPLVELHLKGGRSVSAMVPHAKGAHANPMSDEELQRKFLVLACLHVKEEHARAILDTVWGIDQLDSVRPLMALLGGSLPGVDT